MAFTYMPSGFYSGLRSDSPCQLGLLPPCAAPRENRAHGEASTPLSSLANSLPLVLDQESHPRWRHTPAQASDPPAGLSNLHSGPGSTSNGAQPSQEEANGTTSRSVFVSQT